MQRLALLLLLCLTSTAASAIPLTWVASGTINFVIGSHPELGPVPAAEGDPFAFQFTFDPAGIADEYPQFNQLGVYRDVPMAASLTVAGQTVHFDLTPSSRRIIEVDAISGDGFTVRATTTLEYAPDSLAFRLFLFSARNIATPFASDAIPTSPPDPTLFDYADFELVSFNRGLTDDPGDSADYHLQGHVTALTSIATPVPESATLALFALGLSGMFIARKQFARPVLRRSRHGRAPR